jgi:hypothetical protein
MNKVRLYCNFEFYSLKIQLSILEFIKFDINKVGLYCNFEFYSIKYSNIHALNQII